MTNTGRNGDWPGTSTHSAHHPDFHNGAKKLPLIEDMETASFDIECKSGRHPPV